MVLNVCIYSRNAQKTYHCRLQTNLVLLDRLLDLLVFFVKCWIQVVCDTFCHWEWDDWGKVPINLNSTLCLFSQLLFTQL